MTQLFDINKCYKVLNDIDIKELIRPELYNKVNLIKQAYDYYFENNIDHSFKTRHTKTLTSISLHDEINQLLSFHYMYEIHEVLYLVRTLTHIYGKPSLTIVGQYESYVRIARAYKPGTNQNSVL